MRKSCFYKFVEHYSRVRYLLLKENYSYITFHSDLSMNIHKTIYIYPKSAKIFPNFHDFLGLKLTVTTSTGPYQ